LQNEYRNDWQFLEGVQWYLEGNFQKFFEEITFFFALLLEKAEFQDYE